MSYKMSVVLVLCVLLVSLANLPTAFSRPRRLMDGSGIEADDLLSAKRQSSGCGQVSNNTLTSPGYPNNYPNYQDCVYRVPIPAGKAMNIYFDEFNVEYDSSCSWDYLKIDNENNQAFGVYCGYRSGSNVTVTGNYAVITFHSDSSVTDRGYRLTFSYFSHGTQPPPSSYPTPGNATYPPWFTTSPPNGNATYPPWFTTSPPNGNATYPPWFTTSPPNGGCGYVQNNELTSPGYPNYYPNNMDCTYWIHIPHGKALRIDFDTFEMDDCGYDYLRISNEQNQTFGIFCGNKNGEVVIVTGYYAKITFHSDSSVTDQGYRLFISYLHVNVSTSAPYTTYPPHNNSTYPPWYTTAPPNACGYIQFNVLTSPGYPNYYPHNMDCTYFYYIPYGKALRIYFDVFEVHDCGYDYLRITNERNQTFGEFCGNQTGHIVTVTGRYAVFTFHSDSSINDRGYKLFISDFSHGNASTPEPYTTYPPYTSHTGGPNATYYPSPDARRKLQYYLHALKYITSEMEYVVDNELQSNISVRSYKERVKRAVSDVHEAMNSESRQKRDVRDVMMIGQIEKKAADLMKKLETKEAQYKRRALMKKKLAARVLRKA